MREGAGEVALGPLGEGVGGWARDDVGGASLEHCYVGGCGCEGGEEGYGCGAAAYDYYFLVGVVEVLGPELRVDDLAGEVGDAGDVAAQRFVVVVVAGAENHEASVVMRFTMTLFVDE